MLPTEGYLPLRVRSSHGTFHKKLECPTSVGSPTFQERGFLELRIAMEKKASIPSPHTSNALWRSRMRGRSLPNGNELRSIRSTTTSLLGCCGVQRPSMGIARQLSTEGWPQGQTSSWRSSFEFLAAQESTDIYDLSRRIYAKYHSINDGSVSPDEFHRRYLISEMLQRACINTLRHNQKTLNSSITHMGGDFKLSLKEKVLLSGMLTLSPLALYRFEPIRVDLVTARRCARRIDRLLPTVTKALKSHLGQCCRSAVSLDTTSHLS